MPLLPCVTNSGPSTTLFGLRGATGNLPGLSTINVSSINVATSEIGLGNGEYISTIGNQLFYFNGTVLEPISALSSISTIEDWAIYPAISTIDADLQNVDNVSSLAANEVLTNDLLAVNGFVSSLQSNKAYISSLVCQDISTVTLTAISTVHVISTISSATVEGVLGEFSTLVAGNAILNSTLDFLPDPSTIIFHEALPSTYTISQQIDGLIGNQLIFDISGGITVASQIVRVPNILSTPSLYVSSINGAEFTSTTITIELGSFSSIVATSISSLGAEIRQGLFSSVVLSPSFSLGGLNVNLGLGGLFGNLGGWAGGVLGAITGTIGMATGIAALVQGRQTNYINNTTYELVNGTTQLQFSTLAVPFSTIYRFNDSPDPGSIPGEEIFVSTIHPPGLAVRSVSDPLNTISTPSSTIQAFGQWVAVPESNPSSISTLQDWALFPALSTIAFDVGVPAVIQSGNTATDNIAIVGSNIQLVANYTDAKNLLLVSSISTATVLGANDNLFNNFLSTPGLKIDAPNLFLSTPLVIHPGFFNGSSISVNSAFARELTASSIVTSSIVSDVVSTNLINCSTGAIVCNGLSARVVDAPLHIVSGGPSTLTISTLVTAGSAGQPAGRFFFNGNDVDLGQQDLWCQQVRIGASNPGGSAQTEVIFYSPDGLTIRGLGLGGSDRTIRLQSTVNSGTNNGYLLDTTINPPFFSTINQSTALMAFFPSTNLGVLPASTISFIPPLTVAGSFYSSTSQTVAGANTETPLTYNSQSLNVGGLTYAGSTITVPVAGVYSITHSVQFATTSGGTNKVQFYPLKNGAPVAQANSIVSVVNNGDTLGTIEVIDQAAANDKYGIAIYSNDNNMTATAVTAGATPAVPAVITTIKRL